MKNHKVAKDELRREYVFAYAKAVRGKHIRRLLAEGANVVVLDADIAQSFAGSAAVNEALRSLLALARSTRRPTKRVNGRAKKRAA